MSLARSSTFRCLDIAGKVRLKFAASSLTVASPLLRISRICRLVGSAKAMNTKLSRSTSDSCLDDWLINILVKYSHPGSLSSLLSAFYNELLQPGFKPLTQESIIYYVEHKRLSYIVSLFVLCVVYFVAARFGLTLNAVSGFATLVWAPTGIAIAALFMLGYRFWPSVAIGAFLINLVTGASPWVALGISIGNTSEALVGAFLLRRVALFDPRIEQVKDVFSIVLFGAVFCTSLSATIGVISLWLGSVVTDSTFGDTWLAWWVGDALGVIVIAPLVLVWSQHFKAALRPKLLAEAVACLLALAGISAITFHGYAPLDIKPFTFVYGIFPVLIWIALRFGQLGSVSATFITSVAAIWGTVTSTRTPASTLSHQLLLLQIFMGITAVTFMVMAAVVAEKEQTHQQKQRLAERTALLTKQRTRLLALNKAKDEFIALASHQLRTPATIVKVYSSMLLTNHAGKLSKSQQELLRTAYESNERQLELIDTLLRVARLDTGAIVLKRERVDLAVLIEEIIDSYNGSLVARQQTVHFWHGKHVFMADVDKEKVRIVLENILDNASKYSPSGKQIAIRLHKRQDQFAVSVRDNGVGIVKKDMHKLFKKFSRIDNPLSTTVNGTGLGLYWAKKIVAMHEGSIEVTSRPSKGSTFTVLIPGEGG